MGGDFNALMNVHERIDARVKDHEGAPMRDCMIQCGLEEIKTCGNFFKWSNKKMGGKRVVSRIDRVLGNAQWLDLFLNKR